MQGVCVGCAVHKIEWLNAACCCTLCVRVRCVLCTLCVFFVFALCATTHALFCFHSCDSHYRHSYSKGFDIEVFGPSIADGGPGIHGWPDVFAYLKAFLAHTASANTVPDVVTWHVTFVDLLCIEVALQRIQRRLTTNKTNTPYRHWV